MKPVLSAIRNIAARIQLNHVLSTAAVGFAVASSVFGVTTRAGEIAFGFAILHVVLSAIVESKRPPAWLRTAAADVEKALDGATGMIPLLTALRAVAAARNAPVWIVEVLNDLIKAAPLAGNTTLGPDVSGVAARLGMTAANPRPKVTGVVSGPHGVLTLSGVWSPDQLQNVREMWAELGRGRPVYPSIEAYVAARQPGPSTIGPDITGFAAHA